MRIVGFLIILLGGESCTAVQPNVEAVDLSEAFLPHSLLDDCRESSLFALPILEEWAHSAGTSANDRASIALFEGYVDQAEQVINAMLDNYSQLETLFYPDRDYYLDVLNRLGLRGPALAWWRQVRGDQQDEIYLLCARFKAIRDFTSAMESEWREPIIRGSPEKLAVLGAIYKYRLRLQQIYLMIRAFPGDATLSWGDEGRLARFLAPRKNLYSEYLRLIELLFARLGELGPLCEEGDPRDFRVFGEFFSDAVFDRIDIEGDSYGWNDFRLPEQYRVMPKGNLSAAARSLIAGACKYNRAIVARFSRVLFRFRTSNRKLYWKLQSPQVRPRSCNLWIKIVGPRMVLRDHNQSLRSTVVEFERQLEPLKLEIERLASSSVFKTFSRLLGESRTLRNLDWLADAIVSHQQASQPVFSESVLREILELTWLVRLLGSLMAQLSQLILALPTPKAMYYGAVLYPPFVRAANQCIFFTFTVEKLVANLRKAGIGITAERLQGAHALDIPPFHIGPQVRGKIAWPKPSTLQFKTFALK